MRKKETVTRPAREEEITAEVKCDLCGKLAPNPGGSSGKWTNQISYAVNSVVVSHRVGSSYPEGGEHKTIFFDVCPDCFKTEIIGFFKSRGVDPQVVETDW